MDHALELVIGISITTSLISYFASLLVKAKEASSLLRGALLLIGGTSLAIGGGAGILLLKPPGKEQRPAQPAVINTQRPAITEIKPPELTVTAARPSKDSEPVTARRLSLVSMTDEANRPVPELIAEGSDALRRHGMAEGGCRCRVAGRVTREQGPETNTALQGMITTRLRLRVQVIDCASATILAAHDLEEKGGGFDAGASEAMALQRLRVHLRRELDRDL